MSETFIRDETCWRKREESVPLGDKLCAVIEVEGHGMEKWVHRLQNWKGLGDPD